MYPTGVEKLFMVLILCTVVLFNCSTFVVFTCGKNVNIYFIVFSLQSAASQGFSQEDGATEAVGMVYWYHPDDLHAMEDCDWSIRQTGARGAKR